MGLTCESAIPVEPAILTYDEFLFYPGVRLRKAIPSDLYGFWRQYGDVWGEPRTVKEWLDLESPEVEEPEDFSVLIRAYIGPEGANDRHLLIVPSYSYPVVRDTINSLCQRTWGSDWIEVASKLKQYGLWEFEDYTLKTSQ